MFFDAKGKNVNTKWNVNDFVIGGGNRSRKMGTGVNAKEEFELTNTIRKIDSKFSKTEMELDSIYKDLRSKRKEMRARFKTLESDPENEAAFHKLDVDLMMAQVKITEFKAKAFSDRIKHIRDEKKLNKDLLKGTEVATLSSTQSTLGNSPLTNVVPVAGPQVFRTNTLDPNMIQQPVNKFESVVKNEPFAPKKDAATPLKSAGIELMPTIKVESSVTDVEPIPVTKNWDGRVTSTTADSDESRVAEVEYRLNNAEKLLNKSVSTQGINYERSHNAIMNKKKTIEKIMYINKYSGNFYVRDYEVLPDGNRQLSDTESQYSVMHLGIPEFNPRLKIVKTAYSEEYIPYELKEDDSEMPDYYIGQWAEPDKSRYLVPPETLELL